MSHWSQSPAAIDALASQYVLGTLRGRARRRFELVMARQPALAARVRHWEEQLHRLGATLAPMPPSAALWERLAQQTAPQAAAAGPDAAPRWRELPPPPAPRRVPPASQPGWPQRLGGWLQSLLQPVPAAALAFGLMAGLALPLVLDLGRVPVGQGDPVAPATVPASYIGVLATPDGRQGLIVASLRHAREVELKQVTPLQPPPGSTLYLWTLDAAGTVRPVGPIPSAPFVRAALPDTAERVFASAVELAVSVEAEGATPRAPGSAFLVRGLCGKVWPPAPPASQPR